MHNIEDKAKKIKGELEKSVASYRIEQSGKEEVVEKRLKKQEDELKYIKAEKKDLVVNAKFVSEYTSENLPANNLIVVFGERRAEWITAIPMKG